MDSYNADTGNAEAHEESAKKLDAERKARLHRGNLDYTMKESMAASKRMSDYCREWLAATENEIVTLKEGGKPWEPSCNATVFKGDAAISVQVRRKSMPGQPTMDYLSVRILIRGAIDRWRKTQAQFRETEMNAKATPEDRQAARIWMEAAKTEFKWQIENVEMLLDHLDLLETGAQPPASDDAETVTSLGITRCRECGREKVGSNAIDHHESCIYHPAKAARDSFQELGKKKL